jgi:hypothetical protein
MSSHPANQDDQAESIREAIRERRPLQEVRDMFNKYIKDYCRIIDPPMEKYNEYKDIYYSFQEYKFREVKQ